MARPTAPSISPSEIFDATANIALMHQSSSRSSLRTSGHALHKTRGEVRGGGRSRTARRAPAAHVRARPVAPQFAGGGTVHGPQPRDYSQRTPRR
ncbi:50S ribosomal protein L4 [Rhodococcus hoagii]|nr:50S ribosomal protein L4 [Prescottella equi]